MWHKYVTLEESCMSVDASGKRSLERFDDNQSSTSERRSDGHLRTALLHDSLAQKRFDV